MAHPLLPAFPFKQTGKPLTASTAISQQRELHSSCFEESLFEELLLRQVQKLQLVPKVDLVQLEMDLEEVVLVPLGRQKFFLLILFLLQLFSSSSQEAF